MKLAIAIAIIRRRPAGMTGERYARVLCNQHQQSRSEWKDKAKSMEQELLFLRQKVFQLQMQTTPALPQLAIDEFSTPPPSAETTNDLSTFYSSLPTANSSDSKILLSSHSFLRSLLALGSITAEGMVKVGLDGTLTTETIKSVLDVVVKFLLDNSDEASAKVGLNFKLGEHAVSLIIRLAEAGCHFRWIAEAIKRLILEAVQKLITGIVSTDKLNNSDALYQICQYVVSLSCTTVLLESILRLLFQHVSSCGSVLRQSSKDLDRLQLNLCENIYYIFWCIEQLLHKQSKAVAELDKSVRSEFETVLSESLLRVSNDFPVFAYYVWHVSELLSQIQKNDRKEIQK